MYSYAEFLDDCTLGNWPEIGARLYSEITNAPSSSELHSCLAHLAMRQAKWLEAKALIQKAISLNPLNMTSYAEGIIMDICFGSYELAAQKVTPEVLKSVPPTHPVNLGVFILNEVYGLDGVIADNIATTVGVVGLSNFHTASLNLRFFDRTSTLSFDDEFQLSNLCLNNVLSLIKKNDFLIAFFIGRLSSLFAPNSSDSFLAHGISSLYCHFSKNADRCFHEASFRKTRNIHLLNSYRFKLFCSQRRYAEAVTIAEEMHQLGDLNIHVAGDYIRMLVKLNIDDDFIDRQLESANSISSEAQVIGSSLHIQNICRDLSRGRIAELECIPLFESILCEFKSSAAAFALARIFTRSDPERSKEFARIGASLNLFDPDVADWESSLSEHDLSYEFMGIFIPKEHEGSAWPTSDQEELISIIFDSPGKMIAERWRSFLDKNVINKLDAGSNRLLPYLKRSIDIKSRSGEVDKAGLLNGIWKKSFLENAQRISSLHQLRDIFDAGDIEFVLLKGIANAISLYPDIGCRPMSDIDLLIHPMNIQKAHHLLTAHGWVSENFPVTPRIRFQYSCSYRHEGGGLLDLHWRPCEDLIGDYYDPAEILPYSAIEYQGRNWLMLNPTMNLMCSILHGVSWNHLSPVRWVCDSRLIIESFSDQIDWNKIFYLCTKHHCMEVMLIGLQYLFRRYPALQSKMKLDAGWLMEGDFANSPLNRIRFRSRDHVSSIEEAFATLEHWKNRFKFTSNDHIVICGGDNYTQFQDYCFNKGILWSPEYLPHAYRNQLLKESSTYNLITVDANHSCLIRLDSVF